MTIDINTLLAWGATYKKVSKDEVVFNEGGHCSFYHQVVSGSIRWVNINDEGKEILQLMVEPGESFGDLPLFDDAPYAATSLANEDAVIIRLNKTTFLQLLRDNPEIHFVFSRILSENIRFKFLIVKALAEHNPEKAIAELFNYFKQKKKNICTKCNKVKLTRQQIADMLGLRVETIIRTIRAMHEKGDLLVDKGKVYC